MDSNGSNRQFSSNAEEEKQTSRLLQNLEKISVSTRRWVRAIFVALLVIWLTIVASPILIPYLVALLLR